MVPRRTQMTAPLHRTRLPRTTQLSLALGEDALAKLTPSECDQEARQLACLLLEAADVGRAEPGTDRNEIQVAVHSI